MRLAKMLKLYDPALQAEPRNQKPAIIPLRKDCSLLEWLEKTGQLICRKESRKTPQGGGGSRTGRNDGDNKYSRL